MKKNILLIVLCLACTATFAQRKKRTVKKKTVAAKQAAPAPQNTALQAQSAAPIAAAPLKPFDRPLDGYYKKTNILSAKVTPYPSLREADVAYAKRIWREIDLRMKMNTYLASPKSRL